ncbi:kelch repeat-containing protein [Nakamurella lactea]|uniref:kelch repeat-containing protein n=1 Tax=Nakamurella lactea TaxID=459515 RepID=UPI00049219F0|nr:kelch repeat-containing protein [Nakamurella lactea]
MSTDDLRAALTDREEYAPDGEAILAEVAAGKGRDVRRARWLRRSWPVLAAATVTLLVVAGAVLVNIQHAAPATQFPAVPTGPGTGPAAPATTTSSTSAVASAGTSPASDTTPPSVAPTVVAGAGNGGPTALAAGSWTSLPAGPLTARTGAAMAWTGQELLVWGGASVKYEGGYDDGARYDLASRTWRPMAPSPVPGNVPDASAWTGSKLFVWGGLSTLDPGFAPDGAVGSGALYDPDTDSWRPIPPLPVKVYLGIEAVWTGTDLLVLTWDNSPTVGLHRLDADTDTWTSHTDVTLPADHQVRQLRAVAGKDAVYVFAAWSWMKQVSANETHGRDGIDLIAVDAGSGSALIVAAPTGQLSWSDPLWTGTSIAMPAAASWCGMHSCPYTFPSDVLVDPGTGQPNARAERGSGDLAQSVHAWTGEAVAELNSQLAHPDGSARTTGAAQIAGPNLDRWTSLPASPVTATVGAVWTGDAVLVWGYAGTDAAPQTEMALLTPAG